MKEIIAKMDLDKFGQSIKDLSKAETLQLFTKLGEYAKAYEVLFNIVTALEDAGISIEEITNNETK